MNYIVLRSKINNKTENKRQNQLEIEKQRGKQMKNSISSRSNFKKIIDKTDQELYRFKIQDQKQNWKD